MFIVNGICYAGNKDESIKVKDVDVLRGGMLLVTFTTGEKRLFDSTQLTGKAFEPLKKEEILKNYSIFHGVITWDDGNIDIAPELVYENSYPYDCFETVM